MDRCGLSLQAAFQSGRSGSAGPADVPGEDVRAPHGANGTPIDYGRRRLLDYTGLLPRDRWLETCRRTGTPPGTGRRERIARSQLFQRLSGLPAESAPDDLGGLDSAEFRATALRFTALQTPELAHALQ